MAEAHIRLLCKIASTLPSINKTYHFLKSHYLMQVKKIASSNNLPAKRFESVTRCSHCCLEWTKGTKVNLQPIKLSRRQRCRIKRLKNRNKGKFSKKEILLHGNKMEQICSFCGIKTVTNLKKNKNPHPSKENNEIPLQKNIETKSFLKVNTTTATKKILKVNKHSKNQNNLKINVYSNTHDVFALHNKHNTLPNKIKERTKVIKNCKRKKDKFAGLCKKAVLASATLHEEKQKQNQLDLFLKPSL